MSKQSLSEKLRAQSEDSEPASGFWNAWADEAAALERENEELVCDAERAHNALIEQLRSALKMCAEKAALEAQIEDTEIKINDAYKLGFEHGFNDGHRRVPGLELQVSAVEAFIKFMDECWGAEEVEVKYVIERLRDAMKADKR